MNRNTKTILMILMVLPIAFYNINIVKSTGGLQVVLQVVNNYNKKGDDINE